MIIICICNIGQLLFSLLFDYRAVGLTGEMDSTGSVAAVESALDRLSKQREELEELWATRKMRLDLCLRLRLFERDALEVLIYFIIMLNFIQFRIILKI